jgi:hypothetical protein
MYRVKYDNAGLEEYGREHVSRADAESEMRSFGGRAELQVSNGHGWRTIASQGDWRARGLT